MKLVMLLSFIPNPRMNRRINILKTKYDVVLIYWNRNDEKVKLNLDIKQIEINIKADFNLDSPIKRIINTITFQRKALKYLKQEKPDIIYLQNLDMLDIACKYKYNAKIIYEIADINTLLLDRQKGLIKRLISFILKRKEKKLITKVDLLVITSPKYYDEYFKDLINKDKVIFIPNTPDLKHFNDYKKKDFRPYTIAYIGAIRYEKQLKMLIDSSEITGVNVFIAGFAFNDIIKNYCKKKDHVTYYGPYDYNTEISRLYGKANAIYSVYDVDRKNVRLALPNRLYEAIYCRLPIIVSKGTYLGELVEEKGLGFAIDNNNQEELVNILLRLKNDKNLNKEIEENCIKNKHLLDLDYYNNLLLKELDRLC
ncbi:MAG TPA: glycosyltransferase family 4 protein [Acholeplasmataceae bacterium]|nr:glycosyltransferase family 4 protein [Acholeplasmataceae bacterium]